MASTILPNDRNTILPLNPFDGQVFIDTELIRWVYNANEKVWVKAGTTDSLDLATEESAGLLAAADKALIDKIPAIGGSFGLIVDTKLVLQSESNPDGVIQGDIELHSESLDITCVRGDVDIDGQGVLIADIPGETLDCKLRIVPDLTFVPDLPPDTKTPPSGLSFKLSKKFLDTLVIDLPGPKGKKGEKGDKGIIGDTGYSQGPRGEQGDPGDDISERCTLTGVQYEDSSDITDTAIVNMRLTQDCKLVLTKAKLNTPGDTAASKIVATSIGRSVIFPTDPNPTICDLTRMDDWELSRTPGDDLPDDVQILRIAKGSNEATDVPVTFNTMPLSTVVADIVSYYKNQLVKFDKIWAKETKRYIEGIDDKARGILSSLAGQLADCEFKLPATEHCITFVPCSTETPPPPPPPPPPPSPQAAAARKAGHNINISTTKKFSRVGMGTKKWTLKS